MESNKKEYSIKIQQILEGYVTVPAKSKEEAIAIARQKYVTEGQELPDMEDVNNLIFSVNAPSIENLLFTSGNGAQIYSDENGELMCKFDNEDIVHHLRSHIQDIQTGDCFMVLNNVYTADRDSYQSVHQFDEPGEPWVVYDVYGEPWFEEEVVDVERKILAMEHGKASEQHVEGLPVNFVEIVRQRPSEDEIWVDSFWVDAKAVPTVDLFRAAVKDFLTTEDGMAAIQNSCDDFNWGDAMMYVPEDFWNKHGIYSFDRTRTPEEMGFTPTPNYNPVTFTVDQDEVLIPESYFDKKEQQPSDKVPLETQIAKAKSSINKSTNIEQPKER